MIGHGARFKKRNFLRSSEAHKFGSQPRSTPPARSFELHLAGVQEVN